MRNVRPVESEMTWKRIKEEEHNIVDGQRNACGNGPPKQVVVYTEPCRSDSTISGANPSTTMKNSPRHYLPEQDERRRRRRRSATTHKTQSRVYRASPGYPSHASTAPTTQHHHRPTAAALDIPPQLQSAVPNPPPHVPNATELVPGAEVVEDT